MKPAPSALPDPAQLFARLAGATAGGACAAALGVALLVPLALGGDLRSGLLPYIFEDVFFMFRVHF